jgi:single-strand DNA-binding protein
MARGVNRVFLIGHDQETRVLKNGTALAKLSLATTESWSDGHGQRQERTAPRAAARRARNEGGAPFQATDEDVPF